MKCVKLNSVGVTLLLPCVRHSFMRHVTVRTGNQFPADSTSEIY